MAYITHEDVRRIACFSEDTLLAVKAPFGSTLEVPDPDEGMPPGRRRYEIQLTSRSGPIDVFLIQDHPTAPSATTAPAQPQADIVDSNLLIGGGQDESLMKHFQLPSDPYNFEMKAGEGIADFYGFSDMFGAGFMEQDASSTTVKLPKQQQL